MNKNFKLILQSSFESKREQDSCVQQLFLATKSNWILESKPRVLDKVLGIRVGFPFTIASAAFTATFFHF